MNLESQSIASSKADQEFDQAEPTIEIQRTLKNNTYVIKVMNNDLHDLKRDAMSVINKLWSNNARSKNMHSVDHDLALREKVMVAEDVLMQNLSQTLQSLTSLTSALQEIEALPDQSTYTANKMIQALDLLQIIHARLEKTIQDFPEFAETELRTPRRTSSLSPHRQRSSIDPTVEGSNTVLKKKLAIDRRELTNKLKVTLQKFESSLANDVFVRLSDEIERNQALQDIIENKNFLIHRLCLLFNEGFDKHEAAIQQLCQLADSQDANRILKNILNDFAGFYRNFNEAAAAQNRSPPKNHRRVDSAEFSQARRRTTNRSNMPIEGRDSMIKDSLDKSSARDRKPQIDTGTRWRTQQRDVSPTRDASWAIAEKDKAYDEKAKEVKDLRQQVRELEIANSELMQDVEGLKVCDAAGRSRE